MREPGGSGAAGLGAADPALCRPMVEHRLPDEGSAGQDLGRGRQPKFRGFPPVPPAAPWPGRQREAAQCGSHRPPAVEQQLHLVLALLSRVRHRPGAVNGDGRAAAHPMREREGVGEGVGVGARAGDHVNKSEIQAQQVGNTRSRTVQVLPQADAAVKWWTRKS